MTVPVQSGTQETDPDTPMYELRRIRLDRWRIVYAITEQEQIIDILAVRQRPPHDYGDLVRLLSEQG